MSKDVLSVIGEKLAAVKAKFAELDSEKIALGEQRSNLDKRLGEITTEQFRLQGDYRTLDDLSKGEKGEGGEGKKPDKADTTH